MLLLLWRGGGGGACGGGDAALPAEAWLESSPPLLVSGIPSGWSPAGAATHLPCPAPAPAPASASSPPTLCRIAQELVETKLVWAEAQEQIVKLKRSLVKSQVGLGVR